MKNKEVHTVRHGRKKTYNLQHALPTRLFLKKAMEFRTRGKHEFGDGRVKN